MDLKVLFHNPDELTNEELDQIHAKIRVQREIPYGCAFFAGLSMYLVDNKMLRRYSDWKRIVAAGALGFAVGAINTFDSDAVLYKKKFEKDILHAFDQRQINSTYNMLGFNSNHIHFSDFSDSRTAKKPY